MFKPLGANVDWLITDVVYGLFLADDGVLNMLETELMLYIAVLCQELNSPMLSHLNGLKRMGLNLAEVEGVTKCAKIVAEWAGNDTSAWRPVRELIEWS